MRVVVAALCVFALLQSTIAQISEPLLDNDHTQQGNNNHKERNKFIQRKKIEAHEVDFKVDASGFQSKSQCPHDLNLVWHNEAKASLYSAPVLTDIQSDGAKDIISTTYVRYLEVMEGYDGHKAPGWPYMFDKATFHSSPLLYDVDKDGHQDIIVVTTQGAIVTFDSNGKPLEESYQLPKLPVKRNWYKGLDEHHVSSAEEAAEHHTKPDPGHQEQQQAPPSSGTTSGQRKLLSTAGIDLQGSLPEGAIETWELFSTDVHDPPALKVNDPAQSAYTADGGHVEGDPRKVYVTPHVICNPVIADLDGDGNDELIIAVSYYFSDEDKMDEDEKKEASRDTDLTKYVAGGVVAFDLTKRSIKWTAHLDLTTDVGQYRAYIFSSPNVLDLDQDGKMEVVLGTSLGFIYVLNADGTPKKGFPISMGEIEGHIAAEDLNNDGTIELVAVDFNSNVLCFNAHGEELWETRISGFAVHGVTIGDIDQDGQLDVVVAAEEGHIWALRGDTGQVLPNFPLKTNGRLYSPILLVQLSESPQLQLVACSFDGFMYIIDGKSGCVEKFDIGEHSYAMVLADDVTGNGKMDLVVTTMNGNVYTIGTQTPYHPLKAWPAFNNHRNVYTYKHNYHGIFFTDHTPRDVTGSTMNIQFEIVDERRGRGKIHGLHYDVTISVGGSMVLYKHTYTHPGRHMVTIPTPEQRMSGVLIITMTNEHQQLYTDQVTLSFNLHFHRLIKWILVVPFVTMASVLVLVKSLKTPLPMTV